MPGHWSGYRRVYTCRLHRADGATARGAARHGRICPRGGLIHEHGASPIGKKIFEIGQKYYLEDLGLRHSLLGYRTADIGKILENIVYLHLVIAGYSVRVGKFQNKEVDFVCTRGDEKMYVQVTYLLIDEATVKREFGNLELIYDNHPKFVVSLDENATGNIGGIKHVHVREFIKQLV